MDKTPENVRVRFAPSPTGNLHLGGARTALYNHLFARQMGGTYLLRIEDTDRERSTPESEAQVLRSLDWLGLGADEGTEIIRQSERSDRYAEVIEQLRESGHLYPDPEATPDELGRVPLRLKVEGEINFNDLVRGEMQFHGDNVRDPIVVRSDGTATYNLAAATDDFDMGITHVFRGDDHLSNTPQQTVIHRALGDPDHTLPTFAHLPMILGPDGKRLSKRHGAASVEDYMDYLPEGLLNYLALLGWAPPENKTIFSREELEAEFDITRVGSSPAMFDAKMLDHIQKQHVMNLSKSEWLEAYPGNHEDPEQAYRIMHDKMLHWGDEAHLMRPLNEEMTIDEDVTLDPAALPMLEKATEVLGNMDPEMWNEEEIGKAMMEMCKANDWKPRNALPLIQHGLMGQRRGTSMFRVAAEIGKYRTMQRLWDREASLKSIDQTPTIEPDQSIDGPTR